MTFTSSAGRLPAELLSIIADCIDIQDLLALSHVCARWYAVARAHPTFWRNIRLAVVSDTALEFFQARIESAAGRRISLNLCIEDHPFCDGIEKVVIPAVARSLCGVVLLNLDMHTTTAPHLIPTLLHPAPFLESLGLRFFHHPLDQPVAMFPTDMLAGVCPRLVDLSLANFGFPEQPIAAFQRVQSMLYDFGRRRIIPAEMFDHFPSLQNLTITGNSRLRVICAEGLTPSLANRSLNELQLCLTRCDYDYILSSFPNLASARHVVCRRPRENAARHLVNQLGSGPLDLNFLCPTEGLVHIALQERSTGRIRSLAEFEDTIVNDVPRGVLFTPHLLERYETLRIFAQLAHVAPYIATLPRCHTLEVILDVNQESPLPPADLRGPLRLPELRTVVVRHAQERSTRTIAVDAGQLRTYLAHLLGVRPMLASLKLHGVSVTGDRAVLFRDF